MPHTGFTRVSLRTVAIVVVLLAATLIGPPPIKAALPVDQGNAYFFAPTGVTYDQDVHLLYHNSTNQQVKAQFILLNAQGQDLFALNKINATFIVEPGTMAKGVVPCNGIMGPNQTRVEVTGAVAFFPPPAAPYPFKPGSFLGPASLEIVDEITQQTLRAVGIVGPIDLVGVIGPID